MNPVETISHADYLDMIPKKGRHILAQQTDDQLLVYQAFNPEIADYAVKNQCFGGPAYSFNRMSWIKPNFLWMMYRCGWAEKVNQERVLGIWITKSDFDRILGESVFSSYQPDQYTSHDEWKKLVASKPVRLQWDPDHDIYGTKQERKAIQLGMKGKLLQEFGTEMIRKIIDLTEFVRRQKQKIDSNQLDELLLPKEWRYIPSNPKFSTQIGLS